VLEKGDILLVYDAGANPEVSFVDFGNKLTLLMEERNPSMVWESPDFSRAGDIDIVYRLFTEDGGELLRTSLSQPYPIGYISVRAWGRTGLCVGPEWQREKCFLPACHDGFYRDWEKDGICVADTR